MALYTNNLKNRFLTASSLPQHFCSHLRLASRQWSLAPNKNSEDPSCQIPDSSSCLCISLRISFFSQSYLLKQKNKNSESREVQGEPQNRKAFLRTLHWDQQRRA